MSRSSGVVVPAFRLSRQSPRVALFPAPPHRSRSAATPTSTAACALAPTLTSPTHSRSLSSSSHLRTSFAEGLDPKRAPSFRADCRSCPTLHRCERSDPISTSPRAGAPPIARDVTRDSRSRPSCARSGPPPDSCGHEPAAVRNRTRHFAGTSDCSVHEFRQSAVSVARRPRLPASGSRGARFSLLRIGVRGRLLCDDLKRLAPVDHSSARSILRRDRAPARRYD